METGSFKPLLQTWEDVRWLRCQRFPKPLLSGCPRSLLPSTPLTRAARGRQGYQYWTVGRYRESTTDAYVRADYTTITPKVSGYIVAVRLRTISRAGTRG